MSFVCGIDWLKAIDRESVCLSPPNVKATMKSCLLTARRLKPGQAGPELARK